MLRSGASAVVLANPLGRVFACRTSVANCTTHPGPNAVPLWPFSRRCAAVALLAALCRCGPPRGPVQPREPETTTTSNNRGNQKHPRRQQPREPETTTKQPHAPATTEGTRNNHETATHTPATTEGTRNHHETITHASKNRGNQKPPRNNHTRQQQPREPETTTKQPHTPATTEGTRNRWHF